MALLKPVEAIHHFAHGGRSIFDSSVSFAGKVAVRPPPLVVDDYPGQDYTRFGIMQPRPILLEEPYVLHFTNARVIGFRHIVTEENHLFNDHFQPVPDFFKYVQQTGSPFEDTDFATEGDCITSTLIETVNREIDEPMMMLNSYEPNNYGSWLFRILPKLITARKHHLHHLPMFIYSHSQWQRNMLEFAGVKPEQIVHHNDRLVYKFKDLYVPGLRNAQAYLDDETVRFYRRLLAEYGITQKRERLLYVSRRAAGIKRPDVRLFLNEAEFIAELGKLGFDIVEPENPPMLEQFEKFATAKVVLGPSGSGMFNTVFAPHGSIFISIEAFPYWLHAHSNLPASIGQDYAFIVGQPDMPDPLPVHKRWSLDIPKAIERIKQVILER